MSGQMLSPHNLLHHVVEVNGRRLENFGEGDDVIQVSYREDGVSDTVGADGNMMANISANESAELTLKFLHTAPENQYLTDLYQQFRQGQIGGISVSIYNTLTGEGEVSTSGYIPKMADKAKGMKAGDREWKIIVPKLAIQKATG